MLKENLYLGVLVVLGLIVLLQVLYYYGLYARFSFRKKKNKVADEDVPISVVVVVKDAASTLLKFFPRILNQQYPAFEVVVVNDHSHDDDTELLVKEYQSQYPNVKLVNLSSSVSTIRGSKFAVSMGIRCATYDHILLTDAACAPASPHWLERMAKCFAGKKTIVLGYSSYAKRNNPFNRLMRFDNLQNALQYFSLALAHSTYRGDSRNLAFDKSLFYKQKGFASHNHISCGIEDIFISRAAKPNNTAVEFSPDSFTVLQKSVSYRAWRKHKTGLYYTRKMNTLKNRFLLNGIAVLNLLFYAALAYAVVLFLHQPVLLAVALGIAAFRIVNQYIVFGVAAAKLNEKQVVPCLLLYDLFFAVANPLYYLSAKLNHQKFLH